MIHIASWRQRGIHKARERLKLLAATGTAEHRNVQANTGWHSQHGQQGNMCRTATRLFRKGTSPEREVKKEKSGATVTPYRNAWDTRGTGHIIRDARGNTRDAGRNTRDAGRNTRDARRNMRCTGCHRNIRGTRQCCGSIGRDTVCSSSHSCRMICMTPTS